MKNFCLIIYEVKFTVELVYKALKKSHLEEKEIGEMVCCYTKSKKKLAKLAPKHYCLKLIPGKGEKCPHCEKNDRNKKTKKHCDTHPDKDYYGEEC